MRRCGSFVVMRIYDTLLRRLLRSSICSLIELVRVKHVVFRLILLTIVVSCASLGVLKCIQSRLYLQLWKVKQQQ